VFENRVLRGIFGPERDEVKWNWRKLHNEELREVYCSPNIYYLDKLIKNNEMGKACSTYGFCWSNLNETSHLEHLDINGKIILK
jgi:hypothetical protein